MADQGYGGKARDIVTGFWGPWNYGILGRINERLGRLEILILCEVNGRVRHKGKSPEIGGHQTLISSIVPGGVTVKRSVKFSWRNAVLVAGIRRKHLPCPGGGGELGKRDLTGKRRLESISSLHRIQSLEKDSTDKASRHWGRSDKKTGLNLQFREHRSPSINQHVCASNLVPLQTTDQNPW